MAEYAVHLDDAAIYHMLNDDGGPVGRMLEDLSELGASRARRTVNISRRQQARFPPGFTRASIRSNVHHYQGLIYGGVAAAEQPTIFLEYPAIQMHRPYPFLSTAFDGLEL